jgi:uncharacterized protein (DUF58 family)
LPEAGGPARLAALALALALSAAGIALAEGGCFAAAFPLAAWAALGLFARRPVVNLAVERVLEEGPARPGQELSMRLRLRNRGPRIELLELRDILPPGTALTKGEASWSGSLGEGEEAVIAYSFRSVRGIHRFSAVSALATDPFTAVETALTLEAPSLAVVPPETIPTGGLALSALSARAFSGASLVRRHGGGTDFAGTREYAPGDPLRSLNWRAEARYGQSVVNIFEEERAIDVGIILDARAEAWGEEAMFEVAVAGALAIALDLLEGGNRVAFLSYGSVVEWTAPGLGREQKLRLRMAAAAARLGDHAVFERFDNLPIGLFPPRSSILVVSPLLGVDLSPIGSLAALGYSVTVLRLPASREAGTAGPGGGAAASTARRILDLEASILSSRLSRRGVEVLDWDGLPPLSTALGRRAGRRTAPTVRTGR